MAQSKNLGHGVTFARVTGGPTTIGQIRSITPPGDSREKIEVTDLDDTLVAYLPSLPPDRGEVAIEYYWTPDETVDALMDTDFNANTTASWKIVYPSPISRTHTFSAFIINLTPAPVVSREGITRTVTFVLTSAITGS